MKKKNDLSISEEERKTQDMSAVADYNGEKSNRAKLVEYEGDDYVDTPVSDNSIAGKTENFWYHHKWKVIIGLAVIVIAFIGIYQMITSGKQKTDVSVLYAGPKYLTAEETENLKTTLAEILPEDLDGDGKKAVYTYTFEYYSSSQLESKQAEAKSQGIEFDVDVLDNRKVYSDVKNLIFTGECGVMFIDAELFENVKAEGGLDTLENALGYELENAYDEYGIMLGDTKAYSMYPALKAMPPETMLCVRTMSTAGGVLMSKKEAEKDFNAARKLLSGLLKYEVKASPEEN